jgi:hypothetical protein
VLRRLGRTDEAAATWADLAAGTTRVSAVASVELAKLREHRLGDPAGALDAVRRGWAILDRRRRLGRPEPRLEQDLVRRGQRLRARLIAARGGDQRATSGTRGSGAMAGHASRTWSSAGSNEQAIVRRSPASALR